MSKFSVVYMQVYWDQLIHRIFVRGKLFLRQQKKKKLTVPLDWVYFFLNCPLLQPNNKAFQVRTDRKEKTWTFKMFFNLRTLKLRQEKTLLPSTSSKQSTQGSGAQYSLTTALGSEVLSLNNYEIHTNYLTLLELTALTEKYSHLPPGAAVSTKCQNTIHAA